MAHVLPCKTVPSKDRHKLHFKAVSLVLSCISSFYILYMKPLTDISLVKIFPHTVGSLFFLLLVSLAVQKLFNLCSLFIFCFVCITLGDISAKLFIG